MARILAALTLALVVLGATALAHRVQACEMLKYQRVQPSKHVIVFQAAEGTTGVVNGNMAAVVGSESILLVDTGQFPSIARRVVADIRAASPLPVRHIVNTHWHGDHLLANGVFREAWPQARIVAHPHTIEQGAKFYDGYHEKAPARIRLALEDMRKREEATTSEEERLFLARTRECGEKIEPEIPTIRYVPPDAPFERELRVDLGGVNAVVKHLGSGNTPGDLVVWVEEDRVAIVGDMLVYPAPYAIGSDLVPWSATLARVQELQPRIIVPGHGVVMRNDHYLRDVRALIESTRAQLAALKAAGVAKSEAPGRLDTSAFASRYLDTPMRRQAFEQFFVKSAVHQLWRDVP